MSPIKQADCSGGLAGGSGWATAHTKGENVIPYHATQAVTWAILWLGLFLALTLGDGPWPIGLAFLLLALWAGSAMGSHIRDLRRECQKADQSTPAIYNIGPLS